MALPRKMVGNARSLKKVPPERGLRPGGSVM
jgi:hypothetical protein